MVDCRTLNRSAAGALLYICHQQINVGTDLTLRISASIARHTGLDQCQRIVQPVSCSGIASPTLDLTLIRRYPVDVLCPLVSCYIYPAISPPNRIPSTLLTGESH